MLVSRYNRGEAECPKCHSAEWLVQDQERICLRCERADAWEDDDIIMADGTS